jgi:hypothetical protein
MTNNMNILVVGFGNMGCRHTQSILNSTIKAAIWVIEPSEEIFKINSERIGAINGQLNHLKQIEELSVSIDFAIVATSAEPRFEVVKKLLNIGIKKLLVEKVVFQSEAQFDEIIRLLKQNDAKAYCNFVNRYFNHFSAIKENLVSELPISMVVLGGDFGLGCNGLHYVDLFNFITNQESNIVNYNLSENKTPHKRGINFKEVLGNMSWSNTKGDKLLVSSDIKRGSVVEIVISNNENLFFVGENTQTLVKMTLGEDLLFETANPLYTSTLTSQIVIDIITGKTLLPTIQETRNCHIQFFGAINSTIGLAKNEKCPIT